MSMREKKERLWQIRHAILNLVAEAASLIGEKGEDMVGRQSDTLSCVAKMDRREGINRVLTFEQVWKGDDEHGHSLNVGVVVSSIIKKSVV